MSFSEERQFHKYPFEAVTRLDAPKPAEVDSRRKYGNFIAVPEGDSRRWGFSTKEARLQFVHDYEWCIRPQYKRRGSLPRNNGARR